MVLTWTRCALRLPMPKIEHCVVADNLLVILGQTENWTVLLVDPRDYSWRSVPCEDEMQGKFCATAVRHEVYIFYTNSREDSTIHVRCLDTKTLRWEHLVPSGRGPQCEKFYAIAMGNRAFVFTYVASEISRVFSFDPSTRAWGSAVNIHLPTPSTQNSATVGSRFYNLEDGRLRFWDSARGDTDILAMFSDVLSPPSVLLAYGGRLYVLRHRLCGNDVWVWREEAMCYAVDSDEWMSVPLSGASPGYHDVVCAVAGGKAFVFRRVKDATKRKLCDTSPDCLMDVHVLELAPSLRTLCLLSVRRHGVDASRLPQVLQKELKALPRRL